MCKAKGLPGLIYHQRAQSNEKSWSGAKMKGIQS
jgi:hypothetical protein